ncbi:extracellular calcium-sensing receptor-like [Pleurodeles waltl]|uniref:extracellular calcium-sensing receptor-like n=1 Tax=Pleurodeles waltl TaxID=8319 RepID=UPI003709528B
MGQILDNMQENRRLQEEQYQGIREDLQAIKNSLISKAGVLADMAIIMREELQQFPDDNSSASATTLGITDFPTTSTGWISKVGQLVHEKIASNSTQTDNIIYYEPPRELQPSTNNAPAPVFAETASGYFINLDDFSSTSSAPAAETISEICFYYHVTISHASILSTLSDKLQFPSFLRTVPNYSFQNIALIQLVEHFQWKWVGMVVSNDEVGLQGGQGIAKGIEDNGGCVAFMEQINLRFSKGKIQQLTKMIQKHPVKVIIFHGPEVHIKVLLETIYEQNITNKVWIFTAAFIITPGLLEGQAWKIFNGSLGIAPYTDNMLDFEEFISQLHPSRYPEDILIQVFWDQAFHCIVQEENGTKAYDIQVLDKNLKPCSGYEALERARALNIPLLATEYVKGLAQWQMSVRIASMVVMHEKRKLRILHYLKHLYFKTSTGKEIFFDANGDYPATYDILNVQISQDEVFKLVKVGKLGPTTQEGEDLIVNTAAILWSDGSSEVPLSVCNENCPSGYRKASREGEPSCCYDCVPCSQGEISNDTDAVKCFKCVETQWSNKRHDRCVEKQVEFLTVNDPFGLTLSICASVMTLLTASSLFLFSKFKDTPIVKANNRGLSYVLLISLMCCFLCSFIFISHPTKLTCMLRQTIFGIIFSISVASVLAKTILVVLAFKATNPRSSSRKWLGSKTPFGIVFFCSLIQIVICVLWLAKSPPFPEMNMKSYKEKIIFECNEGDVSFFYCMLGYLGLLATVSFIVAFLARNLPGSFNEAKLITFSMLVFVSVWISFIPAYLSTRGKYMVAVEVFAIQCSGAGLLGCIFFPKCYVILVRPERNARSFLVRKTHAVNKVLEE